MILKFVLVLTVFCFVQIKSDNVADLAKTAKNIVDNFNIDFNKTQQNNPNANYWETFIGKLNEVLTNPQSSQGTPGEKGEKGDVGDPVLIKEVKLLRQRVEKLKAEINYFKNRKEEKGNVGEKGRNGQKGDQGDRGEIGFTGPRGPPGNSGIKGNKGTVGNPGPNGIEGPKGEKGDMGPPGSPGTSEFVPPDECGNVVYLDGKKCKQN